MYLGRKGSGSSEYLGTTGSVLGSTTGDQLNIVLGEELVIKTHVLVLSKDSIVVLQTILLQKGGITSDNVRIPEIGFNHKVEFPEEVTYPTAWMSIGSNSECRMSAH